MEYTYMLTSWLVRLVSTGVDWCGWCGLCRMVQLVLLVLAGAWCCPVRRISKVDRDGTLLWTAQDHVDPA